MLGMGPIQDKLQLGLGLFPLKTSIFINQHYVITPSEEVEQRCENITMLQFLPPLPRNHCF